MLKDFRKKPMPIIGEDPKLELLQDFDKAARVVGHPGPPTPAAGRSRAELDHPADDRAGRPDRATSTTAVEWATQKIEAIYAKYK